MPKKRLDVNWKREVRTEDFKPALRRYTRYLKENGLREHAQYVEVDCPLGRFLDERLRRR
ncbi:MAG TPA: hypothetical protein PK659_07340 [Methanothrix sp.]|nr:hypothetical protein [Methanothrix sp.]HOK58874.1 hypothetical protein [Methanothrix sp.]HOL44046.1 hypothetical protein [Methanothrix sp.]HPO89108.1 hypothetical protein [Methanothrix sp.]